MEQNKENKIEIKSKLLNFYKSNKLKLYIFIFIAVLLLIIVNFIKINNEKNNILISQKYIKANLLLSSGNKEKSKIIYEEIIGSKNKFYSILALNNILEENLITDEKKILEYFDILVEVISENEQKDLLIFKKALYLIKIENIEEGKNLLKNLIKKDSSFKSIAQEILSN
tara:strand:+ start:74 stop:583 length:510 start_codon:yes stop_codon:yes gene_type:complete